MSSNEINNLKEFDKFFVDLDDVLQTLDVSFALSMVYLSLKTNSGGGTSRHAANHVYFSTDQSPFRYHNGITLDNANEHRSQSRHSSVTLI